MDAHNDHTMWNTGLFIKQPGQFIDFKLRQKWLSMGAIVIKVSQLYGCKATTTKQACMSYAHCVLLQFI